MAWGTECEATHSDIRHLQSTQEDANMKIILHGLDPKKLKMAKIILLFKTDDNADANNYRPISLLSNFDRVCEKLIFNRMEYLKVCELSYDHCSYERNLNYCV